MPTTQLTDLLLDAVIVTDVQACITYWNPAAHHLFGWTAAEVRGRSAFELLKVSPLGSTVEMVRQIAGSVGVWEGDVEHTTKSGRTVVCATRLARLTGVPDIEGDFVIVLRDVTERWEAERRLRDSEAWLHECQRVARLGTYRLDVGTGRWTSSPVLDLIFGIGDGFAYDVAGWLSLVHPDDRAAMKEYFHEEVLGRRQTFDREYRVVHRSTGDERWVHGRGELWAPNGGPVLEMVGTIQDITDRKRAELASREREALLRQAETYAGLGHFSFKHAGQDPYWSEGLRTLLGVPLDRPLAWSDVLSRVHPADRERVSRTWDEAFGQQADVDLEYRVTPSDGPSLTVRTRAEAPPHGTSRWFGTTIDVTDQRRIEAELRTISCVVEQGASAVIITDPTGRIEYVNPSFEATTGYTLDDVRGQTPRVLKSGLTSPSTYRALWETIGAGRVWRGEFHNRRKDGRLYWERATVSPVFNHRGAISHFVAVKEDITAQKAAEQAARDAQERLDQAQRLEALGRLAGGIAHDFNNLLTAILGYCDFVASQVTERPALAHDVGEIQKAGERAARLTRQLLTFSRNQPTEAALVDLGRIVTDLTTMLRPLIGDDIRVHVSAAPDTGCVYIDPSYLEQVVMNLAINAKDAMPTGGRLALTVFECDVTTDAADRLGCAPGPYIALCVSDSGVGMTPEVLARAVEPFFTTKPEGRGTGLGLATVHGILQQQRGALAIDTEPGRGTSVTCYFPRAVDPAVEASPASTPHARHASGPATILLVEDEASLRTLAKRMLETAGYRVVSASNGAEALAVEAAWAGSIDLLVSDIVMPELSGPALAQRLIPRRPQLRVLYTSGFAPHAAAIVSQPPRTAFLAKPFTQQTLVHKVREVLERSDGARLV